MTAIRPRKLPSGKRTFVVDFRDETGKRRRLQRLSKEQADELYAAVTADQRQAKAPGSEDRDLTVRAFAEDRWLPGIEKTLAPKTYRSYRQLLRLYVFPVVGSEPMRALHEAAIGNLLTAWTNRGKSSNTVRLIRAVISTMYADASDPTSPFFIVPRNPAKAAGGSRARRAERKRQRLQKRKRLRVLDEKGRDALIAAAEVEGIAYQAILAFMADVGPRPAEATRLRWEDVSWRDSTAWIWATKTSVGRTVELTPRVVALLRAAQTAQKKKALKKGKPLPELAFVNIRDRAIDQSRLTKRLKRALGRAGLPTAHGLYDLRHTCASLMLEAGQPITRVAEQLGDSVETTMRYYLHAIPRSGGQNGRAGNEKGTRTAHGAPDQKVAGGSEDER